MCNCWHIFSNFGHNGTGGLIQVMANVYGIPLNPIHVVSCKINRNYECKLSKTEAMRTKDFDGYDRIQLHTPNGELAAHLTP